MSKNQILGDRKTVENIAIMWSLFYKEIKFYVLR